MENPCILGMDYLFSHRCELDFRTRQLMVERRREPLRTVEHRRPRTPEPQLCREVQRDPMRCHRAAVKGTEKASEDVIRRLQGKDGYDGCHTGAACRSTSSRKRHRAHHSGSMLHFRRKEWPRTGQATLTPRTSIRCAVTTCQEGVPCPGLPVAIGCGGHGTGNHAWDDCEEPGGDVPRSQDLNDWKPPRRRRRRRSSRNKSRGCRFVSVGTTLHGGGCSVVHEGASQRFSSLLEMDGSRRQSPSPPSPREGAVRGGNSDIMERSGCNHTCM